MTTWVHHYYAPRKSSFGLGYMKCRIHVVNNAKLTIKSDIISKNDRKRNAMHGSNKMFLPSYNLLVTIHKKTVLQKKRKISQSPIWRPTFFHSRQTEIHSRQWRPFGRQCRALVSVFYIINLDTNGLAYE